MSIRLFTMETMFSGSSSGGGGGNKWPTAPSWLLFFFMHHFTKPDEYGARKETANERHIVRITTNSFHPHFLGPFLNTLSHINTPNEKHLYFIFFVRYRGDIVFGGRCFLRRLFIAHASCSNLQIHQSHNRKGIRSTEHRRSQQAKHRPATAEHTNFVREEKLNNKFPYVFLLVCPFSFFLSFFFQVRVNC